MIKDNLSLIQERIARACSRVNRNPREINIIAVTKGRSTGQIKEAIEAGLSDIGENRVQEALLKYNVIRTAQYAPRTRWHMVGHLQGNKVKNAVRIFDLIQSVDSLGLAAQIDKEAYGINKIQDILIEIKTSPEAAKFGLKPEDAVEVIKEIRKMRNINIKGLMTIAPIVSNPEEARSYFRALKEIRDRGDKLQVTGYKLKILSMGMSDDFEVAIEEGATMVRLGRAIFERK